MGDLMARLQAALGDAYLIERELPGGGMSRLFLARESSLHRQVVIKLLPPEYASEVSETRFRQEIEVAARLQHTNILTVLTAGARDDLLYYIMPFVPGESLRHRLVRHGKVAVGDAIAILREIADALAHAHGEGVIHRDVKPENILLLGSHAVLTDFGVARALEQSATGQRLTATGVGIGTPGYMPPEQATGDRNIDERVDVYALAVVGYEMLAGVQPFDGPTTRAIISAQLADAPRPLRDLRPETPAPVSNAIGRALVMDPNARLGTAAEFRDALGHEQAHAAGPVSRRLGIGIAAAATVTGIAVGGVLLFSKANASLDPNLLAVAPFDVVSRDLAEYREGFLTILSRSLDGAGPLRTVSPTIVVRRWAGKSEAATASAFGQKSGAGLVVYGEAVLSGADSARVTATLYDVKSKRAIGEIEVRDRRQRIDRIADSLAVRLLRELGRTRPVGAVRFAALGSSSLPAIKVFLQAEQFYRRGQWDSTVSYNQRVLALDSNFTLALRRIANSAGWIDTTDPTPILLREGAMNHGLAPRESLLVLVDSSWGAWAQGTSASTPLLRRMLSAASDAVTRYPEDPDAWYMMGEVAFHMGGQLRLPPQRAFDAFAKAIALDSAFAPAYEHIVSLALQLQAPEIAREHGELFTRVQPEASVAASMSAALDLLAHPRAPASVTRRFFDTAGAKAVWASWFILSPAVDSGEAAVTAARAFTASKTRVDPLSREDQKSVLAFTLAYRGHFRDALKELVARRAFDESSDVTMFGPNRVVGNLIDVGAVSHTIAVQWMEKWLRDSTAGIVRPMLVGLAECARVRDNSCIQRYQRVAQARQRSSPPGSRKAASLTYGLAVVPFYQALASGDTTKALALSANLPDSLCLGCIQVRLLRAHLQVLNHDDRAAAALLDASLSDPDSPQPQDVLWAMERGRVNERLGNRDKAIDGYSFVVAAWRDADPEVQPLVEEARAGLRRLGAESLGQHK